MAYFCRALVKISYEKDKVLTRRTNLGGTVVVPRLTSSPSRESEQRIQVVQFKVDSREPLP